MILQRKQLGEIIKLEYGKPLPESERKAEGQYPVYGANGIKSRSDLSYVNHRSIIIGRKGSAGELNLTEEQFWPLDVTYFVTFDEKKYDLGFLYRLLASLNLPKLAKGVKPGLNRNDVYSISVKIPELIAEQKRIAQVIDAAETLCQKRKQAIGLLDDYSKSVFLEMFGDPIANPKGWEIVKLEKIIKYIKYGTSTPPVFSDAGKRFIRATNIDKGKISDEGIKFISVEEASKITKCRLHAGDFLVVRSGVNAGDSAVVAEEYHGDFAGYDLIIRFNESVDPVFIGQMFLSTYLEKRIKPLTRRAAQPHINSDQVKQLKVILPPKKLQDNFSEIVKHTENLKQKMFAQSEELEKQFQVLMQKAFNGKL